MNSGQNPSDKNRLQKQAALNAFLVAADALDRQGKLIEAEVRYNEALNMAIKEFGDKSDQAVLILSILAAFYRSKNRDDEAVALESRIQTWDVNSTDAEILEPGSAGALSAQLNQAKKKQTTESVNAGPKTLPANIRRACQVLGLALDQPLTVAQVNKAWKVQLLQQGAHPDLGGNTDEAVILNSAKNELLKYLEFLAPKQGFSLKKTTGDN